MLKYCHQQFDNYLFEVYNTQVIYILTTDSRTTAIKIAKIFEEDVRNVINWCKNLSHDMFIVKTGVEQWSICDMTIDF